MARIRQCGRGGVDVAVRAGVGRQAVRTIHLAEFSRHPKLMGGDARDRPRTPSPAIAPQGTKRTKPMADALRHPHLHVQTIGDRMDARQ
jgi:hypothetical protein